MSNQMISYERKGVTSSSSPTESSSSQAILRNQPTNSLFLNQPKAILSSDWCNFCAENHEESTYEVKKRAQEIIFGKDIETTIVALDWDPEEDVMLINTIDKSYVNKEKGNIPKTTFALISSSQNTNPQVVTEIQSPETSVSFPLGYGHHLGTTTFKELYGR